MNYRPLAGELVSILGFGAMRLPSRGNEVLEDEAVALIRKAVDMGVNYVDTAYFYHGGKSEVIVGKALSGEYSNKAMVATKLPIWLCHCEADLEKHFSEQLSRLNMDRVDFYMVHGLGAGLWQKAKSLRVIEFLERKKAEGRIGHIGFSFHDRQEAFLRIVDEYKWEFCQIQYNFMDENFQAGTPGLEYAAAKGLGVIIMEPLRGGNIANGLPESALKIYDSHSVKRSPAEWALRWVWNRPEAAIALSGMNSEAQLVENIRVASDAKAGSLTRDELAMVGAVRDEFLRKVKVGCTNCGYCLPCPTGVDIPQNFSIYNGVSMYANPANFKLMYNAFMAPPNKASACVRCGQCEPKCPQGIKIMDELAKADAALRN